MVSDKEHIFGALTQCGNAGKMHFNIMRQKHLPHTRKQGWLVKGFQNHHMLIGLRVKTKRHFGGHMKMLELSGHASLRHLRQRWTNKGLF